MSDHDDLARRTIQAMLNGQSPNGEEPQDYGKWHEPVTTVKEAYDRGGVASAKRAYDAIAKKEPDLATLIAGDQDQGKHWQLFTLADAYKPREPRKYVVSGLVKMPSLSIIYGAPGTLKTMLLIDMAACVASGQPWLSPMPRQDGHLGQPGRQTFQTPILWCDFDNGGDEMHERIEAIGRTYSLEPDAPFYYVTMPDPWLDASDYESESFTELLAAAYNVEAKLIIIDNLGIVSGNVDENSAEMSQVLSALRRLAEATGAAVVLVHHQRKASGVKGRAGDTLRGHSSIEAALDLALLIEREEQAASVTVKATKVRGADIFPFGAMFTFEHKEGTDELARARFFGVEIEDLSSDAAIRRAIIEALKFSEGKLNKKTLADTVKGDLPDVGINRIRSAIDWMALEGKLAMEPGNKTEKLYSLPDAERIALEW
jgi:hypothetical protein